MPASYRSARLIPCAPLCHQVVADSRILIIYHFARRMIQHPCHHTAVVLIWMVANRSWSQWWRRGPLFGLVTMGRSLLASPLVSPRRQSPITVTCWNQAPILREVAIMPEGTRRRMHPSPRYTHHRLASKTGSMWSRPPQSSAMRRCPVHVRKSCFFYRCSSIFSLLEAPT